MRTYISKWVKKLKVKGNIILESNYFNGKNYPQKKNHPNFLIKTKAKAKTNYNQNTFIVNIFNPNALIKTL